MHDFEKNIATLRVTTITESRDKGNESQKQLCQTTCPTESCRQRQGLQGANMTTDEQLQFQIRLSNLETEAMTWSFPDMECVTIQHEREIYGIPSNEQKRVKKDFFIQLIDFEGCCETINIEVLRNTIQQHMIHFGYPKIHLWNDVSESIRRMNTGDNLTTDISERLHIANVKEPYPSRNKVD